MEGKSPKILMRPQGQQKAIKNAPNGADTQTDRQTDRHTDTPIQRKSQKS